MEPIALLVNKHVSHPFFTCPCSKCTNVDLLASRLTNVDLLASRLSSKLEEGINKGIVGIACSKDAWVYTNHSRETLEALKT